MFVDVNTNTIRTTSGDNTAVAVFLVAILSSINVKVIILININLI